MQAPPDPLKPLVPDARIVLGLVGLLTVTLIVNNVIEKAHLPIPQAIVTVTCGLLAGGVTYLCEGQKNTFFLHLEDASALEFMMFFLAPIIFAEGYGMKSRQFFENLSRILAHAFLGTAISTVVVATLLYWSPRVVLGGLLKISAAECLAFGALISATDPVTTLAIFKDQRLVEKGKAYLYYSILGESILNDAVGITLFQGFSAFVREDMDFSFKTIPVMLARFLLTFFGSMVLGIMFGMLTALVLKVGQLGRGVDNDDDEQGGHMTFNFPEIGTMMCMSYLPHLAGTALEPLSGIVTVLFAGITARRYAHHNLTLTTRRVFLPTVELLAMLCETWVFLLIGLGFFILQDHYNILLIGWVLLACMVARAAQVYPLAIAVNCCSRAPRASLNDMHITWLAGLRGAVAFMCALSFPASENGNPSHRKYIITTTIVIVFVSMLAFGWPTSTALRCLGITTGVPYPDETQLVNIDTPDHQRVSGQSSPVAAAGPVRWCCGQRMRAIDSHVQALLMTGEAVLERQQTVQEAEEQRRRQNSFGLSQLPVRMAGRSVNFNATSHGPLQLGLGRAANFHATRTPSRAGTPNIEERTPSFQRMISNP